MAANHEFSCGQFEINLWHSEALDAADRAFRFKTAVQELARQRGQARHLHGQAVQRRGRLRASTSTSPPGPTTATPLFDDPTGEDGLSDDRASAIAGVLAHAPALAALLQPDDQLLQALRPGHPGALADRLGPGQPQRHDPDPAGARPGVADGAAARRRQRPTPTWPIAGLLAAAYLGIRDKLEPPATLEGYGYDTEQGRACCPATSPPRSTPWRPTPTCADLLGEPFVAAFCTYKRNELERFSHWVTDWEFREYAYHL